MPDVLAGPVASRQKLVLTDEVIAAKNAKAKTKNKRQAETVTVPLSILQSSSISPLTASMPCPSEL